jgi:DNA excision repair protein ERCC-3
MVQSYHPERPLIVQADRSLLVDVHSPLYAECRDRLAAFAELRKSPEHIHTYAISQLSLWNACAAGITLDFVLETLSAYSRYEVPANVLSDIQDLMARYGRLRLVQHGSGLALEADDLELMSELRRHREVGPLLQELDDGLRVQIPLVERGRLKQALVKAGLPVEDLAGYTEGAPLPLRLLEDDCFSLRDYQREAAEVFWAAGGANGGSGVLVLPCGAGKTLIGLGVMAQAQTHTLILCTSITALRQWTRELLARTDLSPDDIGEYTGERKELRPVTLTTYQLMTSRGAGSASFPHLDLIRRADWGLIIYDEVHLLPAPVFRVTAEIQSRRRLGLTATLVREDGKEEDVFSLIGPKKFDVHWKELEQQGWIAQALCTEVRVPMEAESRRKYVAADRRAQYRLAAENPNKIPALQALLLRHQDDRVLVMGQYLEQLQQIAQTLGAPVVAGKTPSAEREQLFDAFRRGDQRLLIVSKVGNFAVDLPGANVAIELSGMFGSRQEEAQRLGRILRPKADGGQASFYAIVSHDTVDQTYSDHRQLFLTEQGYRYSIEDFAPASEGSGGL